MANLLKWKSVLILFASFYLASCSEDNMIEGETAAVTMRNFAQADAGSYLAQTGEIKRIFNEVSDNWESTVFKIEEGQMVLCDDCNMDDFEITQVFLCNDRPNCDWETLNQLYSNGSATNVTHTFTGKDFIGIDMNYNGEYVRMSDIDVFSQS